MDVGEQIVNVFQGGSFSGPGLAGLSLQAIQLLTGRLRFAVETAAATAQANALRSQWDVAVSLVLRRTNRAGDLPGGGNFTYTQPGWKKDWPSAAIPPIPPARKDWICGVTPNFDCSNNREFCESDKPDTFDAENPPAPGELGARGECEAMGNYADGTAIPAFRALVLFTPGEATPQSVAYEVGCFSLGQGGCELPDDARVGLSLITWPILVDAYTIPWGGAQLSPLVALLTSPGLIHVKTSMRLVQTIEARIRAIMRHCWKLSYGPPVQNTRVTVWPDGAYVGPAKPEPLVMGGGALRPIPGVMYPGGHTAALPQVDPAWFDLARVSAALRTIKRFYQCRAACLREFASLPQDVKVAALANAEDFNSETIKRHGGPYSGKPPPPPSFIPTPKDKVKQA
jgi:hypothetical protein